MKKPTILYLDDEKENLDVFYYAFNDLYHIVTKTLSKDAFAYITGNEVQVLLCDQRMPDTLGVEFIQQVKNHFPDIITILITAYSDIAVAIEAINKSGVFRYVEKPWNEKLLKITLDQAIEKYELVAQKKHLLSKLKKQNEQLLVEKSKAEESARLKTAFLGNISHEVRTPMNIIMGFSELLAEENKAEKRKHYSSTIQNSCSDLLRFIDDIVILSELQSGTYKHSLKIINKDDLRKWVENFIDQAKLKYNSNNLTISFIDELSTNTFCSYIESIRICLSKIIDNAFKFTESGNIIVVLLEEEEANQRWIKAIVSDTGKGIKENDQNKIFDVFFQAQPEENSIVHGIGVGLSIVKAFVTDNNGNIKLKSELGRGSEFEIFFPVFSNEFAQNQITNQDLIASN